MQYKIICLVHQRHTTACRLFLFLQRIIRSVGFFVTVLINFNYKDTFYPKKVGPLEERKGPNVLMDLLGFSLLKFCSPFVAQEHTHPCCSSKMYSRSLLTRSTLLFLTTSLSPFFFLSLILFAKVLRYHFYCLKYEPQNFISKM